MLVYFMFVLIVILIFAFREKKINRYCRANRRLEGRTVLVTGGTSGMGLEIATDLADRGARVIVACPFVGEGERARKIIIENSDNDNVVFKLLDLQSMESVKGFARDILESEERLDILMNNAGTGFGDQLLTKDGFNFTMAVNYYGAFLLTMLLLPLLRKSGTPEEPAKILNTASTMHYIGTLDFDKMNTVNYWSAARLYCNSKLCLTIFTLELAERLKGQNVVVNAVDPGLVGTPIFSTYFGTWGVLATSLAKFFAKTPWQGAQTALHAALHKRDSRNSGSYFKNCGIIRAKEIAYDDDVRTRLWEDTTRLVRLDESDVQNLLQEEEIGEEIIVMVGASEEAAALIGFALMLLGQYPAVQAKVYEELAYISRDSDTPLQKDDLSKMVYLDLLVKEVLRLYPSVPLIAREVDKEIKLSSGRVIPAGAGVIIPIIILHRNPTYWGPDAEHFDPERFLPERLAAVPDNAYMPFSYGRRGCPGYKLATYIAKIGLCAILRRYKIVGTPAAGPVPHVRTKFKITLKAANNFEIELMNRN